ncbi:MAG: serine/threonine protein kinase [Planctomycetes bacterium]|nr:serine/threonine protein kinase [Planctomycetota bacterium]
MARLGAYEVEAELGRGGFARVLRGRHVETGAVHALKVLDGALSAEDAARFRREAEALARVAAADVVGVHDAWVERGRMVLAMDLMPGGALRARMGAPWPWQEAATLVAGLARTLERCHAAGLVHRDVKPENVLFDAQGRARLADFGCARDLAAATLTETGAALGTPAYMAPEQLDGQRVDGRADAWALGVVLHELLTGERPFAREGPHGLLAALACGARPRPARTGAPAAIDAALRQALEPRPGAPRRRRPSPAPSRRRWPPARAAGGHGRRSPSRRRSSARGSPSRSSAASPWSEGPPRARPRRSPQRPARRRRRSARPSRRSDRTRAPRPRRAAGAPRKASTTSSPPGPSPAAAPSPTRAPGSTSSG